MPKTKVSAADVEYFSLPKDFASLHNLKDLMQYRSTTLELENNLKQYETNLTKYTKDYFASFTMNLDEVLLYVSDINEYSICLHGNDITLCNKYDHDVNSYVTNYKFRNIDCIQLIVKKLQDFKYINKKTKFFLVDTVNKKIEICYWLIPKLKQQVINKVRYDDNGRVYKYKGDNDTNIYFLQRDKDSKKDVINYTSKKDTTFKGESYYSGYSYRTINVKKQNILEVTAIFYRIYSAYESKSSGFGGRMTTREAKGWDVHHFCMDTNRYLGFQHKSSFYGTEDKSKGIYRD